MIRMKTPPVNEEKIKRVTPALALDRIIGAKNAFGWYGGFGVSVLLDKIENVSNHKLSLLSNANFH